MLTCGRSLPRPPQPDFLRGSPGSAIRVEGHVQCVASPEEGEHFRRGEVLVAAQTDHAWTLIFPRASVVVSDIGAALFHAASVARELGIEAVVGCGDATARLETGDRVRADAGTGVVTILRDR